jgi:hypothetical protein
MSGQYQTVSTVRRPRHRHHLHSDEMVDADRYLERGDQVGKVVVTWAH